jgi:hypothetical protein
MVGMYNSIASTELVYMHHYKAFGTERMLHMRVVLSISRSLCHIAQKCISRVYTFPIALNPCS